MTLHAPEADDGCRVAQDWPFARAHGAANMSSPSSALSKGPDRIAARVTSLLADHVVGEVALTGVKGLNGAQQAIGGVEGELRRCDELAKDRSDLLAAEAVCAPKNPHELAQDDVRNVGLFVVPIEAVDERLRRLG